MTRIFKNHRVPTAMVSNRSLERERSGRVLVSRSRGCWFEPQRRHCVVSVSKTHYSVLVQPRKTSPDITEIFF